MTGIGSIVAAIIALALSAMILMILWKMIAGPMLQWQKYKHQRIHNPPADDVRFTIRHYVDGQKEWYELWEGRVERTSKWREGLTQIAWHTCHGRYDMSESAHNKMAALRPARCTTASIFDASGSLLISADPSHFNKAPQK